MILTKPEYISRRLKQIRIETNHSPEA